MPKVKISEYSATANSNTDVASINIDEGCAPSGINNAIRAIMGHLKDFQQGTNGDPFNGPVNGTVGATTANTGAFTTLSSTGASSFATSSGNVGIGTSSPQGSLDVTATNATVNQFLTGGVGNNLVTGIFRIGSGSGRGASIQGFRGASSNIHSLDFYTYNSADVFGMRLDSSGNLLVGTTSASAYTGNSLAYEPAGSYLVQNHASAKASGAAYTYFQHNGSEIGSITQVDTTSIALNNVSRIKFPATQSASSDANTLDDYEEGTWTPLMSANGGGSNNWTSSTATGRYTKIGRLVSVQCTYTYTAKQSLTGDYAWMTGLPFNPTVEIGYFYVGINNTGGADTATYSGIIFTSGAIGFIKDQNSSSPGYMVGSDFPAATRTITFQAMYIV